MIIYYLTIDCFSSDRYSGLYLDACTGYQVEENEFYSDYFPIFAGTYSRSYGLVINNSGPEDNMIYKNNFHNLRYATIAQNQNRNLSGHKGLQYKCNNFVDNYMDIAFSQNNKSQKPITPYADIEYQDGFIVYSIGTNNALQYPRLRPLVINLKIMKLKYVSNIDNIEESFIKKSQKAIRDYVNTEAMSKMPTDDQIDYLKLCALMIIWGDELVKHPLSKIDKLSASKNRQVKDDAEIVRKLFDFYSSN